MTTNDTSSDRASAQTWEGTYRILRTRGCAIVVFAAIVLMMVSMTLLNFSLLAGSEAPAFFEGLGRAVESFRSWFQRVSPPGGAAAVQILLAAAGFGTAYLLAMRTYDGSLELESGNLRLHRFPFDETVDLEGADITLDNWMVPMLGRRGTRCRICGTDGEIIIGGRNHSPASGSYDGSGWDIDLQLDAATFGAVLATLRRRDDAETPAERDAAREDRGGAGDRVQFLLSPSSYRNAVGSSSADGNKILKIIGAVVGSLVVLNVVYFVVSPYLVPLFAEVSRIMREGLAPGTWKLLLAAVPLVNIVIFAAIYAGWSRRNRRRIWLAVQQEAVEFGVAEGQPKYTARPEELEVAKGCYEIFTDPPHPNFWIPAVRISFPEGAIIVHSSETAETKGELPWSDEVPEFDEPTDYSVSEGDWGRLLSELGLEGQGWDSSW